jgi:hypothetical protein
MTEEIVKFDPQKFGNYIDNSLGGGDVEQNQWVEKVCSNCQLLENIELGSQVYNSQKFAEQLKDKIRLDIAQFLPEDEWQRLVEAEVKAFIESRWEKEDYYRDRQRYVPSGLRLAVQEVMERHTKKLAETCMCAYTDYSGLVSAKIDSLISENLEGIVRGAVGPFLQNIFNRNA